MRGRHHSLTPEAVKQVRQWAAIPRQKRRLTRLGMALSLGVSEHTISRAANATRAYAKVQV